MAERQETMERRLLDPDRDYGAMVEAQRLSWDINFPDDLFIESIFRTSLKSAVRRGEVFVYEEEGEVIGWLWLDLGRPWVAVHIRHIQVVRSRWGLGYGRRILQDAMAICREHGGRVLTLNVTKSN
ncbi:MAG: GNAT family N-acetyltransferase, partial [Chloroflexi bacterium]|nr:GNAT family N-acetyltransferase [Chloroflexota bacterium]